jgi:hypothetical protein
MRRRAMTTTVAEMSPMMSAVPRSGWDEISNTGRPARNSGTRMWRSVRTSSEGVTSDLLTGLGGRCASRGFGGGGFPDDELHGGRAAGVHGIGERNGVTAELARPNRHRTRDRRSSTLHVPSATREDNHGELFVSAGQVQAEEGVAARTARRNSLLRTINATTILPTVRVIGTTVGNYEVQRLIAEGGMGKVYLAVHGGIGRQAAIKVLSSGDAADPEIVSRFITEARAANAIRHPNIVDIYDSGVIAGGSPYIVMEYLEGETLRQVLDRGPVRLCDMVDWGCQVAEALAAAHAHGVIHRDLKPDNLFLIPDSRRPGRKQVKVLDFGIAKMQCLTLDQVHKTRTGALLGTPLYMSPEQCLSLKDIDARSDIYSLGVILYEMATGKRPFDGDGLFIVISMHITAQPEAPSICRADLPPEMEAIILQALAKEPAKRQASMAEVLTQLSTVRADSARAGEVTATSAQDGSTAMNSEMAFGREHILAFLVELDRMLREPVVMEIIGGAAALLAYGARLATKDINSFSDFDERIVQAAPLTTQPIPLRRATVPLAPSGYDDRRQRLDLPLRHLVVWVPDRHDLLLMKVLRAWDHDLKVIAEMHQAKPFDLDILVDRYNDHMDWPLRSLGGHERFDRQIRLVFERLFGVKHVRHAGRLTMF